jgi:Fic-DOC domain mobile mystery protein B
MTGDDLDDLFGALDDATPLTAEEREGLIPSDLAYRRDLNRAEQLNILQAQDWALARRRDLLTEKFLRDLHRRMLGDVWRWAGRFRTTERNIGIRFYEVPMAVRTLCDDARVWIEHQTYSADEIAVRVHHRLVQIHPFPNGNGRHSRLVADLLVMQLGRPRFTWGRANLQDASEVRRRYIDALRAADNHDVDPILAFARS